MSTMDADKPLKPAIHVVPHVVREALEARDLMDPYNRRRDHQRNDDVAWIDDARRDETKHNRLGQQLDKLQPGGPSLGRRETLV